MIPTAARIVMLMSQLLRRRGNPLADGAEKRRAVFADRQTMVDRYEGRGAFRTWPRGFLEDYVEGGTKPREDGQIELSCAPAWEAANFRAQGHNITTAVRNLHVPFALVRAERGSTCRPPFPMLLKRRDPAAHVMQVPGSTHFLPMEFPDVVAKEMRGFAARLEREGR
jgi:pimeloyl-ACP methyl ester carboxylesterase